MGQSPATALTLVVIPVSYDLLEELQERVLGLRSSSPIAADAPAETPPPVAQPEIVPTLDVPEPEPARAVAGD